VYITTFPAAIVDLTNPAAYNWIKNIIKENMINFGLHGWMCDFGEYLPTDSVLHSGENAEKVHNMFPVLWAKVNREALEECGKLGEVCFFMRAGYTGTSRYSTAMWAGDQLVNWSMDDGLATVIPAGLSLGFSGIGFTHSDIGGYTTVAIVGVKRSKELFMRWTEQSVFTPIMRTHEGNQPEANWQYNSDEETLAHFAKMSKLFVAMKDYHIAIGNEYVEKGIPLMRHPYLHYETDQNLHKYMYQYMYGPDLFVAPIYKKGRKKIKVYLPDDRWVHVWTGKVYGRGIHTVEAPIGQPAVFYREGSNYKQMFEGFKNI